MSVGQTPSECSCDDGRGMIELGMIETDLEDEEGHAHPEFGMIVGEQFWPFRYCPSCGGRLPAQEGE